MKLVHTLVDYDNAKQYKEDAQTDVPVNLALLSHSLARALGNAIPNSQELLIRLYGGWIYSDGQLTRRAGWLLSEISNFRRKIETLRLRFTMVQEILTRSDLTFIGTYHKDQQKMVDIMIAVDLLFLARETDTSLALVSDDGDCIPSLVASAELRRSGNPIHLLRHENPAGAAINDHILRQCNVIIVGY